MALDFSIVRAALSFYQISLKKEFDILYASLKVDATVLTNLQAKISSLKTVQTSIELGNGIPTDTLSRGITARAFDAKIADIESQRIDSTDFATIIANYNEMVLTHLR